MAVQSSWNATQSSFYPVISYVLTYLFFIFFLFVGISVSFSQTTFTVNEHDGNVTVELTLSRPSPCCLHLYVKVEDITATSKLWLLRM